MCLKTKDVYEKSDLVSEIIESRGFFNSQILVLELTRCLVLKWKLELSRNIKLKRMLGN